MGVKPSYAIPYSLNKGHLDREIQLSVKGGINVSRRPLSFKTVAFFMAAIIVYAMLALKTYIWSGSFAGGVLFTLGYLYITVMLSRQDKAKRYGYDMVFVYLEYLGKSARSFFVQRDTSLTKARRFFGIDSVSNERSSSGHIRMVDGRYARILRVVGNASTLLFDEDRDRILSENSDFYRSLPEEEVELIFDTVDEPQRVDTQIAVLEHDKKETFHDLMEMLYDEDIRVLKYEIAGYKDPTAPIVADEQERLIFRPSHQYLTIVASSEAVLNEVLGTIAEDVNGNGYVFKWAKPLDYEGVVDYYRSVFAG